jgi:hypothetical protein
MFDSIVLEHGKLGLDWAGCNKFYELTIIWMHVSIAELVVMLILDLENILTHDSYRHANLLYVTSQTKSFLASSVMKSTKIHHYTYSQIICVPCLLVHCSMGMSKSSTHHFSLDSWLTSIVPTLRL